MCKQNSHPVYIDRHGKEFGIYCLTENHLALIYAALNERGNRIALEQNTTLEQNQIKQLKTLISYEISVD